MTIKTRVFLQDCQKDYVVLHRHLLRWWEAISKVKGRLCYNGRRPDHTLSLALWMKQWSLFQLGTCIRSAEQHRVHVVVYCNDWAWQLLLLGDVMQRCSGRGGRLSEGGQDLICLCNGQCNKLNWPLAAFVCLFWGGALGTLQASHLPSV